MTGTLQIIPQGKNSKVRQLGCQTFVFSEFSVGIPRHGAGGQLRIMDPRAQPWTVAQVRANWRIKFNVALFGELITLNLTSFVEISQEL